MAHGSHRLPGIISESRIPKGQILIKIPLLIPRQGSIWEPGRMDEGTDVPKQGHATGGCGKGQHPGMLHLFESDFSVAHPHSAHTGQHSLKKKKKGLKPAEGFGWGFLPFHNNL